VQGAYHGRMVRWLFRAFVLLIVLLAVAGGVAAWYIRSHTPFSSRAEPSRLESAVALRLRHLSIPSELRGKASPLPATRENLREGLEHFADHCAVCHGNSGAGDTPIGRGLYPKPPVLADTRTQSLSDGELFAIIQNGIRFTGMPAFGGAGDAHAEEDSWRLVQFIRHLPKITKEELAEMEKLNPRAPADAPSLTKPSDGKAPAPHTHKHSHGGKG
jgi:mono/diheme cytochrome c family protein